MPSLIWKANEFTSGAFSLSFLITDCDWENNLYKIYQLQIMLVEQQMHSMVRLKVLKADITLCKIESNWYQQIINKH